MHGLDASIIGPTVDYTELEMFDEIWRGALGVQ